MIRYIENLKNRIFLFLVLFALLITVLALIFSFNIIYSFQKWSVARSAEFNLQLVANLIEQDLRELTALARWCSHNQRITDYFLAEDELVPLSINAWTQLSEHYLNNRAGRYVRRLLVYNSERDKFLQVGSSLSNSIPLTIYNLDRILEAFSLNKLNQQTLIYDTFIFSSDRLLIPYVYPVYNSRNGEEIGTVFMGVNTAIFTDKLRDYNPSANSQLYLGIGGNYYLIENDRIIPGDFSFSITGQESNTAAGAMVLEGRDNKGKRHTLLSYKVRDEIVLTHVLEPVQFVLLSGAWPALAGGLGILVILLVFMVYGVNRMNKEIKYLMEKIIVEEKNKRNIEYRMLQSQINPHFIYNTLNSIKWMATIQNATGIAEMTTALSRFLKILSNDIREMVPLKDELSMLDDYMVIQKYRYGDSVNFEKQITEEELLDTPIPRFILQPLVENAIFHGIEPKGSGKVLFSVHRQKDDVLVSLSDNGIGMDSNAVAGIGLKNIDERLRYSFGGSYGIAINSEAEKGTTVTFRLPAFQAAAQPTAR